MAGYTKIMQRILDSIGTTGVNVLLVEGDDDTAFFRTMLEKKVPSGWSHQWSVQATGGKSNLLRILDAQPNWIGMVDRDEWDLARITQEQGVPGRANRLYILPRFCIESYMVYGPELWAALPAVQQATITGGEPSLTQQLQQNLSEWVRHGALWHAINPLHDGLRVAGFKDTLLDITNAQSDTIIQQKLRDWDVVLDPDVIWSDFQGKLVTANTSSYLEKVTQWVHGKKYFNESVLGVLNTRFGQRSSDAWFTDLQRDLPLPADLNFLWSAMGFP